MLRPLVFMIVSGILGLVAGAFFLMKELPSRNVTVIFIDITESDTGKAWTGRPFREQFVSAVNSSLTGAGDVLAAYLVHGKTIDEQPFWTNAPLSYSLTRTTLPDSSSRVSAYVKRQHCIEAFDSLAVRTFLQNASPLDSMLMQYTDVLGAFQQAALYFNRHATQSNDKKRVYLLSDTKQNAGFAPGNIKLNNIGSMAAARRLSRQAFEYIKKTTDIYHELKRTEVHMLSPNGRLYYNDERNIRRIFWEDLLLNKLECKRLYYF
jgi:hypothetical protein